MLFFDKKRGIISTSQINYLFGTFASCGSSKQGKWNSIFYLNNLWYALSKKFPTAVFWVFCISRGSCPAKHHVADQSNWTYGWRWMFLPRRGFALFPRTPISPQHWFGGRWPLFDSKLSSFWGEDLAITRDFWQNVLWCFDMLCGRIDHSSYASVFRLSKNHKLIWCRSSVKERFFWLVDPSLL